jgi:hypothetical protein
MFLRVFSASRRRSANPFVCGLCRKLCDLHIQRTCPTRRSPQLVNEFPRELSGGANAPRRAQHCSNDLPSLSAEANFEMIVKTALNKPAQKPATRSA